MMDITAKILQLYFTESNFKFKLSKDGSAQIQMHAEAKLSYPKSSDDKTALLRMKVTVSSVNKDDIYVEVFTNTIFEFSEVPEDYEDVSKNLCVPMAQKEVLTKIDRIMENMGYPPFNLGKTEE